MHPYLAMIRSLDDRGFIVEYPDLPGCSAVAEDFRGAQALARTLLPEHLLVLQAQGIPLPEPRTMKEMQASGLADGAIPVLVPVPLNPAV